MYHFTYPAARGMVMPRRPSPQPPIPYGLWSLWDMLDQWGYKFLGIGTALGYIEVDLQNHRRATNGSLVGHGTSIIDPDHPTAKFVRDKFDEILGLSGDLELGAIPQNIRRLYVKFIAANRHLPVPVPVYTNDVLQDVERIKNDFLYILSQRFFYYLQPEMANCYGKPELFGAAVAKKFKSARDDIEHAGNCLAVNENTACVLHLMRAMEAAVRHLAKKLKINVGPKDSWGKILNAMTAGIDALPDNTERKKRKKEEWAECRTNLYHVKMAWRDNSMHGKITYDSAQARDIMGKVKAFMQQLATL